MGSVHGSWLFIGSEKNVHEFAVHGRNAIEKPFPHLRLIRKKDIYKLPTIRKVSFPICTARHSVTVTD